jgi:uncharacterized protein with PIN domain
MQFREVAGRFALHPAGSPFQRCLCCIRVPLPVVKGAIRHLLAPQPRRYYGAFWCGTPGGQIYWRDS